MHLYYHLSLIWKFSLSKIQNTDSEDPQYQLRVTCKHGPLTKKMKHGCLSNFAYNYLQTKTDLLEKIKGLIYVFLFY